MKKPSVRSFVLPTLLPSLESVLGRLGYNPKKTEMDGRTLKNIEEELAFSKDLIHPAANTIELPVVKTAPDSVELEGGLAFRSVKLSQLFAKAKQATVLVCTIGQELKAESDRLSAAGEMTRAVILDAIASEAVESFADYVNDILKREHSLMGLQATMRFSPGYGDLRTDIHAKLLPILDSEKIGVRFHPENYILYPEKTITAVIGWTKS